ncbi:MAG: DUF551 domain-containing protein [Anaerolineae bacterium]|nr:DUF551 domain-containing protein [Anaerolineae bacterium]
METTKQGYVLQKTEKSYCPSCNSLASLFCPKSFNGTEPAYYLCFGCGYIGQVGVGPVTGITRGWIKVSDQIPPDGKLINVIIVGQIVQGKQYPFDEPEIACGHYLADIDLWSISRQDYGYPIVSHWSLIPDLPLLSETQETLK